MTLLILVILWLIGALCFLPMFARWILEEESERRDLGEEEEYESRVSEFLDLLSNIPETNNVMFYKIMTNLTIQTALWPITLASFVILERKLNK